jgi:hypothetical protein
MKIQKNTSVEQKNHGGPVKKSGFPGGREGWERGGYTNSQYL